MSDEHQHEGPAMTMKRRDLFKGTAAALVASQAGLVLPVVEAIGAPAVTPWFAKTYRAVLVALADWEKAADFCDKRQAYIEARRAERGETGPYSTYRFEELTSGMKFSFVLRDLMWARPETLADSDLQLWALSLYEECRGEEPWNKGHRRARIERERARLLAARA